MNLVKLSETIIKKLKKDASYKIESPYSNRQFITIAFGRSVQAVRGLWLRLWLKTSGGIIFKGRRVVVEHAYAISAGGSLILEDNVHINALSKNGIKFGLNVTIAKDSILICTGVIAKLGEGIEIGD